jgi:hypothetical protein
LILTKSVSGPDIDYQKPYSPATTMGPRVEMFQKGQTTDSFFNMKALAPRPISDATEFDTDFEEDMSEVEDNSPRLSVNSVSGYFCPLIATANIAPADVKKE